MSVSDENAVVIGGGIIGTACAHYLAQEGFRVTILESDEFGQACSHANCGLVSPSHVLPLSVPGAVGKSLKTFFTKDSPLKISPRLNPALWLWLFKFSRRCNYDHMIEAGHARRALLLSSKELYREILSSESLECEWESRGAFWIYKTRKEWEAYKKTDQIIREVFDIGATPYEGDAILELEPALRPGLAGGWLYEIDQHVRPDRLLDTWRSALEKRGVTIREHTQVQGFSRNGSRAIALETSEGPVKADKVVVATGALTPMLQKHLGCKIPIQPGKGYSITMPRPNRCPSMPLCFIEHKVIVTPYESGYRLGSTMEFSGYDSSMNRSRLNLLKRGAEHYLHEPYCDPVEEEWHGWRPMTYDGIPIIGQSPAMENVFIAAGHNMLGISMAPATGKLIAEIVRGATAHVDPAPYSPGRF